MKIKLTQGKFAIVDDRDYEWLNQWEWYYSSKGYAVRGYPKRVLMHRVILNTPDGLETDHINLNRLDNRRSNLRSVTSSQNNINKLLREDNKSGFKGVYWHKASKKWLAQISLNRKHYYLGIFVNPKEAAFVYDQAALKYHREFARLNLA